MGDLLPRLIASVKKDNSFDLLCINLQNWNKGSTTFGLSLTNGGGVDSGRMCEFLPFYSKQMLMSSSNLLLFVFFFFWSTTAHSFRFGVIPQAQCGMT